MSTRSRYRWYLSLAVALFGIPSFFLLWQWRVQSIVDELRGPCFIIGDLQYVQVSPDIPAVEVWTILNKMRSVRGPETLDLKRCHISNEVLDVVGQMTWLRRLDLGHTTLSDSQFDQLSRLTNLQYLRFSGTHISNVSLPTIAKFSRLEDLRLDGTSITEDRVWQDLSKLQKLNWNETIAWINDRTGEVVRPE